MINSFQNQNILQGSVFGFTSGLSLLPIVLYSANAINGELSSEDTDRIFYHGMTLGALGGSIIGGVIGYFSSFRNHPAEGNITQENDQTDTQTHPSELIDTSYDISLYDKLKDRKLHQPFPYSNASPSIRDAASKLIDCSIVGGYELDKGLSIALEKEEDLTGIFPPKTTK